MSTVKHVRKPSDVPKGPHFAIFKFFSRSHTLYEENDSSIDGFEYEAYTSREAWVSEITHLVEKGNKDFVACKVMPGTPSITVKVEVQDV